MKFKLSSKQVRFLVVGTTNAAVDITVLNLLVHIFKVEPTDNLAMLIFNSISVSAAIITSFLLNKRFVFKPKGVVGGSGFWKFAGISLIGAYVINNTILNLSIAHMGGLVDFVYRFMPTLGLGGFITRNFITIFIAKLVAGLCSMVWNYWAYGKFVFKDSAAD